MEQEINIAQFEGVIFFKVKITVVQVGDLHKTGWGRGEYNT